MSLNFEMDDNCAITSSQTPQCVTTHIKATFQTKDSTSQGIEMGIDRDSINDSGYGPSRQSFAATEANIDCEGKNIRPLSRAVPLPPECGSNLLHYPDTPLDELTGQRFAEVLPVIEALLSFIPKPRCEPLRRMFLGKDGTDVNAYIVIFCNKKYFKRVQNAVTKPRVRALCESGVPLLRTLVIPRPARPTLDYSNIEICRNKGTTLCGTPILFVNKSEDTYSGDPRKATIGGIIKITSADGNSGLYVMTASHVLDDWQNASDGTADSDSAGTTYTYSVQDLDEFKPSASPRAELECQNILSGSWDFADNDAFGRIIESKRLDGFSNKTIQPSHDWLLFTAKTSMPNELCALKSPGYFERRELREAARPTFHGGLSEPVIMIGGSNGPKRGELSSLMSRIMIGSSDNFVDAYMLTLNEKDAICEGDSGSWVVHNGSPLVFGHVVATDVFGDAYVIPLVDTFDDIKRCMGAESVKLPATEDFEDLKAIEAQNFLASTIDAPVIRSPEMMNTNTIPRNALQPRDQVPPHNGSTEPSLIDWPLIDFHRPEVTKPSNKSTCAGNAWRPVFSTLRRVHEKTYNPNGDPNSTNLELPFNDYGSEYDSGLEVLEAFCRGSTFGDVKLGKAVAGNRRSVWLDDRENGPGMEGRGNIRIYENPLTATGLYRALGRQRFNHKKLPDASRRLIYISDLDPTCIHALAATASRYEASALRNAIPKYLAFQTSIEVKISSTGLLTFQLDFHLPFFILSKSIPPRYNTNLQRRWTDLSFLMLDTLEPQHHDPEAVWGMQDAQVSCVIVGTDDWQWVGYGFVDSEIDGLMTDCSETDLRFDPIACQELDANLPIRHARDYWLRVFEIRVNYVGKRWASLLYQLQRSIDGYLTAYPLQKCLYGKAQQRATEIRGYFDWALKAVGILRRLKDVLSNTLDAWARFSSPDGDISHFNDSDGTTISPHGKNSIYAIKRVFWRLEGVHKSLLNLSATCSEHMRALEFQLMLKSKEDADLRDVSSEFTVSILYPTALAACIFSMQAEVIPFALTPISFFLAVLILILIVYIGRRAGRVFLPVMSRQWRHFSEWISLSRRGRTRREEKA